MNQIENINSNGSLFIICPFCQLESFLKKKFGEDIFFMTVPAGVLNFCSRQVSATRRFIKREQIKNIYLVNDVGCNFIEEAIKNEKEFGLTAEEQLRKLLQNIHLKTDGTLSMQEKKRMVAENNVQQQVAYLASEKILKHEISTLKINVRTLIVNKHEPDNYRFRLN